MDCFVVVNYEPIVVVREQYQHTSVPLMAIRKHEPVEVVPYDIALTRANMQMLTKRLCLVYFTLKLINNRRSISQFWPHLFW